jgi:poly-gamma-glutamate capsule biosynthesis protein CapA/YwtB (metallophosphatase superfamily)
VACSSRRPAGRAHPRPIEIYKNKLVLYGCGDFITDYEGITGYEQFRDDLVVMYFPRVDPDTGELVALHMMPLQIRRMQLVRPSARDVEWLRQRLADVSRGFGCDVAYAADDEHTLIVQPLVPSARGS